MLHTIADVQQMIAQGRTLILAAHASTLAQLPAGDWIGGSASYFMGPQGGLHSESLIDVTGLPPGARLAAIREYPAERLAELYRDAPANGFTFLLAPSGSPFLAAFASNAANCQGFLLKPVVGWVTGVSLAELGKAAATVVDGRTRASSSSHAIAMHVDLPEDRFADLDIVNIFAPGNGDAISFPVAGFTASSCCVGAQPANLAEYMVERRIDPRLPLIADYHGSRINVSVQSVDAATGEVHLYAPVFPGLEYRFAQPVADYSQAFAAAMPTGDPAHFSCNCIVNYVQGEMEGKSSGGIVGPVTFGEIAHLLLNQTLVQLKIRQTA
jgi:hypothetical protein